MQLAALLQVQDLRHAVYRAVVGVPEAVFQPGGLEPTGIPLATLVSCHQWHGLLATCIIPFRFLAFQAEALPAFLVQTCYQQHRQRDWEGCDLVELPMQKDDCEGADDTYVPQQCDVVGRDQAIRPQASLCTPSLGRSLAVRKIVETCNISRSRTSTCAAAVQGNAFILVHYQALQ